jgi:hypothetical protein
MMFTVMFYTGATDITHFAVARARNDMTMDSGALGSLSL